MINKNIKRMLLFFTLLILLVGIVNATDTNNNTLNSDNQELTLTHETTDITTNTQANSDNTNNIIQKQNKEKTLKTKENGNNITIDPINDFHAGNTETITGTYKDSHGNPMDSDILFIEFQKLENGGYNTYESIDFFSYDDGTFEYDFKTDEGGKYQVRVSDYYDFANNELGTSATRNFTVLGKITTLTIDKIDTTEYSDTVTITGSFSAKGEEDLSGNVINININGKQATVRTDFTGDYKYNYKTNTVGVNNITVSYSGNANYYKSSITKTFTVSKKSTKITLDNIVNTQYTDNVTITGKYTDTKGTLLKNLPITININDNTYKTTTDNYGLFSYDYKTNQTGTNTVTVSSTGDSKYKGTIAEKTFKVIPKTTKLTINKIADTQYTDTATITGQLTDIDGSIISNCPLTITLNKVKTTTRTDKYGKFKFTTKADKIGSNTVSITSTADDRYAKTTTEKTFEVTPQTTKITINNIANTPYTDIVTITGKLTDKNNVKLEDTYLSININGKSATVETDEDGLFKYSRKTNQTGTNKVTVTFKGNTKI